MAKLSLYNEFGDNNTLLAIEPASACIAHCTYCFAELNRREQWGAGKRNVADPGTFESTIEKANSLAYDPTDITQWAIKNRIPISYANTVEPFQDAAQGIGILQTCDAFNLPLFIQTKGVNFAEVWPHIRAMKDNATLLVSMGTEDDRAIKRFEPGTPLSAERWKIILTAANAGMDVILALSPYHEDLCDDPAGMVRKAKAHGVESIFFDRMHLSARQRRTATDKAMVDLATKEWDSKTFDHVFEIYNECVEQGLHYTNNYGDSITEGCFSTRDTIGRVAAYTRGSHWPYFSSAFHNEIDYLYFNTSDEGPIVAYWKNIIGWTERDVRVDQPFSRTSISTLMAYNKLSPAWKTAIGEAAPPREYFRAFFNTGKRGQFIWNHPYIRMAMRPDGSPWRDPEGNLVTVYDPLNHSGKGDSVVIDDIEEYRTFGFERVEES